jgi:hypothetical protein
MGWHCKVFNYVEPDLPGLVLGERYGSFTYSRSEIEDVYRYIENQELDHRNYNPKGLGLISPITLQLFRLIRDSMI